MSRREFTAEKYTFPSHHRKIELKNVGLIVPTPPSFSLSDLANTSLTLAEHWWRQTAHCACQTRFSVAPTLPVVFGSRRSPIFCYHLLWWDKTSLCVTAQIPASLLPLTQTRMHVQHAKDNPRQTCLQPLRGSRGNLPENCERKAPNFLTRLGNSAAVLHFRCGGKDQRGTDCPHRLSGHRHVFLVAHRLRHPRKKESKKLPHPHPARAARFLPRRFPQWLSVGIRNWIKSD